MKQFVLFFSLIFFCGVMYPDESVYKLYAVESYRDHPEINKIIDFNSIDYSLLNAAVFFRTNEIRQQNGLGALEYNIALEKAAVIHSDDMVQYNFFSHTNTKNVSRKMPDDRAKLAGITNPYIAENIANNFAIQYKAGSKVQIVDGGAGVFKYPNEDKPILAHTYLSFAVSVVDQWMNSDGHKANILSKDALELGVGTTFFKDKLFNNIPKFMAVQNFQFFEKSVIK